MDQFEKDACCWLDSSHHWAELMHAQVQAENLLAISLTSTHVANMR